jgi:predicted negative regulator of RcsB-dependent stress response
VATEFNSQQFNNLIKYFKTNIMKKIAFCLIASSMLLTFQPLQTKAATTTTPTSVVVTNTTDAVKAKTMLLRLNEIKEMNKTNLNSSEKKSLRKEVRSINRELKTMSGGVYLSVGAVIIIILLLIILL